MVLNAVKLSDCLVVYDLEHRRRVATLSIFYEIRCNSDHALESALPVVLVPARMTRLVVFILSRYLDEPRSCTVQFSR